MINEFLLFILAYRIPNLTIIEIATPLSRQWVKHVCGPPHNSCQNRPNRSRIERINHKLIERLTTFHCLSCIIPFNINKSLLGISIPCRPLLRSVCEPISRSAPDRGSDALLMQNQGGRRHDWLWPKDRPTGHARRKDRYFRRRMGSLEPWAFDQVNETGKRRLAYRPGTTAAGRWTRRATMICTTCARSRVRRAPRNPDRRGRCNRHA